MDYHQMNLFEGQDSNRENLRVFQGASRASLIRLQDCVRLLVTNVTYGRSTGVSLAKLSQNGLWLKMYGDSLQASLDGSFEEYSEIFPTWGMMLGGVVTEPPMSEQFTAEKEYLLLPTPTASLGHSPYSIGTANRLKNGVKTRKSGAHIGSSLKWDTDLMNEYIPGQDNWVNPDWLELVQGLPEKWTKLEID